MRRVEIELPLCCDYDDLQTHVEESASVGEALEKYAVDLEWAAERLRYLKSLAAEHDVTLFAEEDLVEIEAADDVLNKLESAGLVLQWLDKQTRWQREGF